MKLLLFIFFLVTLCLTERPLSFTFEDDAFVNALPVSTQFVLSKEADEPMSVWEVRKETLVRVKPIDFGWNNSFDLFYQETFYKDGVLGCLVEGNDDGSRTAFVVDLFDSSKVVSQMHVPNNGDVRAIYWLNFDEVIVAEMPVLEANPLFRTGLNFTIYRSSEEPVSFGSEYIDGSVDYNVKRVGNQLFLWEFRPNAKTVVWFDSDGSNLQYKDYVLHTNFNGDRAFYLTSSSWGMIENGIDNQIELELPVGESPISAFFENEWLVFDQNCNLTIFDFKNGAPVITLHVHCNPLGALVHNNYLYLVTSTHLVVYKLNAGIEKTVLSSYPHEEPLDINYRLFTQKDQYLVSYSKKANETEPSLVLEIFNISNVAMELPKIETHLSDDGNIQALRRFHVKEQISGEWDTTISEEFLLVQTSGSSGSVTVLSFAEEVIYPPNCLDADCKLCKKGWTGKSCTTEVKSPSGIYPLINCAVKQSETEFEVFFGYINGKSGSGFTPNSFGLIVNGGNFEMHDSSFVDVYRRDFAFSAVVPLGTLFRIDDAGIRFGTNVGICRNSTSALLRLFGAVFGLNNSKKDPEVPLAALLEVPESQLTIGPWNGEEVQMIQKNKKRQTSTISQTLIIEILSGENTISASAIQRLMNLENDPELLEIIREYYGNETTFSLQALPTGLEQLGSVIDIYSESSLDDESDIQMTEFYSELENFSEEPIDSISPVTTFLSLVLLLAILIN